MSTACYIGLGSNLENPLQQLQNAISHLRAQSTISELQTSALYRSKAVGPGEQNDYLNAVALFKTTLDAHALLSLLQAIETKQGRVRLERWGARTLDLDMLLYGDQCINTATLTVPHPRMKERNFVLQPLLDLNPTLVLPDGTALKGLALTAGNDGLQVQEQHWI